MRCEKCKKNTATIRMQSNTNGLMMDTYLCEDCSEEFEISVLLDKLFKGLKGKPGAMKGSTAIPPDTTCGTCGMAFADLTEGGNLGCTDCYQAFLTVLEPVLSNTHGAVQHIGKLPKRNGEVLKREKHVDTLRTHMRQAIEEEDFNRAAFLRDQIKKLAEVNDDEL